MPSNNPVQPSPNPNLPRLEDPRQRKALGNLLRFLALILILTFIAQGTSAATIPKVETALPTSGEVVEKVQGNALVTASGSYTLPVPEGLTVQQLLVLPGQKVEAGEAVARYKPDEVAALLAREEAALQEMNAKLKELEANKPHDSTPLASARTALDWSKQDLDAARANGDAAKAAAQNALDAAAAKAQAAIEAQNNLPEDTTSEQKKAIWEAARLANTAKEEAQKALQEATAAAAEAVQTAERALASAQTGLSSAEISDAETRQTAANTAALATATAQTQRLDIAKQQEKIELLKSITSEGLLQTTCGGIVLEAQDGTNGANTTAPLVKLADAQNGYQAELTLDKADAEKLSAGAKAEITTGSNGYYNPTVEGTLLSLAEPDAEGNVKATLRLPESDWKQGQNVEVQIIKSSQNYPLCVPVSALRQNSSGYYLLAIEHRKGVLGDETVAVELPVQLKAKDATLAAVDGNLYGLEGIITSSTKPVEAGNKVRGIES